MPSQRRKDVTTCAVVGTIPVLRDVVDKAATSPGPGLLLRPAAPPTEVDVTVVLCDRKTRWQRVAQLAGDLHPVVAVQVALDLAVYRRALALGAAVVDQAAPPTTILQVVRGVIQSEGLLPIEVARFLAARPSNSPYLAPRERTVLMLLAQGLSMAKVAATLHYSDRTIRRLVQGLHLRFGTNSKIALLQAVHPHLYSDRT